MGCGLVVPDLVELSHAIHAELLLPFAEQCSCVPKRWRWSPDVVSRSLPPACGLDRVFRATVSSGPLVVGVCAEYDWLFEIGYACCHNIVVATRLQCCGSLRRGSNCDLTGNSH